MYVNGSCHLNFLERSERANPVHHSVLGGGGRSHVTSTHNALDLTVQSFPLCKKDCPHTETWPSPYRDPGPASLYRARLPAMPSGGQNWIPVQTCSLEDVTLLGARQC